MASSRGRERMREQGQRQFVFGSSTPRDLSYMNKMPQNLRTYNAKVERQQADKELSDYMKQARSLSRGADDKRAYCFGSSTPRQLSHQQGLPKGQKAYDARPVRKSSTMTTVHKTSGGSGRSAPPPVIRPPAPKLPAKSPAKTIRPRPKEEKEDDDVSSEPDFVQDRHDDFAEERRKARAAREAREKEEEMNKETKTETHAAPSSVEEVAVKKIVTPGTQAAAHIETEPPTHKPSTECRESVQSAAAFERSEIIDSGDTPIQLAEQLHVSPTHDTAREEMREDLDVGGEETVVDGGGGGGGEGEGKEDDRPEEPEEAKEEEKEQGLKESLVGKAHEVVDELKDKAKEAVPEIPPQLQDVKDKVGEGIEHIASAAHKEVDSAADAIEKAVKDKIGEVF